MVDPTLPAVIVLAFCLALAALGIAGHVAERAVERERLAVDEEAAGELDVPGRHCEATGRIAALLLVEYRRGQRDRLGGA
jgi:hypothetical protein